MTSNSIIHRVVGDLHGKWAPLNTYINFLRQKYKQSKIIIFQVGDFGWWPKWDQSTKVITSGPPGKPPKPWDQRGLKLQGATLYWCSGNHEDLEDLAQYRNKTELFPGCFYMPRGEILTIEDGRNVLFMGGADSPDKNLRTAGRDWFSNEVIQQQDIWNLPDTRIDIIISHTAPSSFLTHVYVGNVRDIKDPSIKALDYILERYRPTLWYFGHWHRFKQGYDQGVKWVCLNMAGGTGWYCNMD